MFRSILIILRELLNISKAYIKRSWFIKYIKICLQNVCKDIVLVKFVFIVLVTKKKINVLLIWTIVKIYATTTSVSMDQFYSTANEFYNIWRHFYTQNFFSWISRLCLYMCFNDTCICALMIPSNILRMLDRNIWSSDKLCIKIFFLTSVNLLVLLYELF